MDAHDFTDEQRRYLEGFVSGVQAGRAARGLRPLGGAGAGAGAPPSGPDAAHLKAMARFEAEGKALAKEEKAKRDEHPFDAYARLKAEAESGRFPKGLDNFRWRFHGLFYVAPNQDAFMCRLRIPNGALTHWQFAGVADMAERYGGGYSHVTTRANLQIREIAAENGPAALEGLADLGLWCKGSGADNIRNVTGSPTAGIDPQELLDTRPLAKAWHHHVLNDRSLHGLPRKFNVAFDGGGVVPVLEDTNDIAFTAVRAGENAGAQSGVWLRLGLGGITGHKDFARGTGVYVKPSDAVAVADAVVREFIEHGDRTNRGAARLKYVLDAWGMETFLAAVERRLGRPLTRIAEGHVSPSRPQDRQAHIGARPQKQEGLVWIGVALPGGRITVAQMRALSAIARDLGDGDLRLTVWQNLLISGVRAGNAGEVESRLAAHGLTSSASSVRAGLVACTGSAGCRFAGANTKAAVEAIAARVESRLSLDSPVNIHVTGCHHSCAQHYIGDIGLIACRIPAGDDGDTVDGFHVYVGGGFGPEAMIGRELYRDAPAGDCPALIERMLLVYLEQRRDGETFQRFTRRHETAQLKFLFETREAAA